ncbi:MAG TPA: TonB-dependent receptor [Terriglobales bacterium]|nr:TonB-dependent receptor [Terriglobales bacterium]
MPLPRIAIILCCFLVFLLPVVAQSPNANINGQVLDSTASVIAGADVLVVNDVTGVQYSTKTNNEGIYVLPNLPPGPYRIQVSKTGFKTIIKPDITLNVQDAVSINFTLPVGAAMETITVQGGAPLVNTQSASVSTVIDRKFVENLPLNGRSFNTLLQLTPGVVIAPSSAGAPGQFSVAGQRTDANNFTVDGVSANFGVGVGPNLGQSGTGAAQAFSALGGTSSLVSVDALQEFRTETSSFAPEFGRSPGGQVILTTRSGTNTIHGGVFDYLRNTVMDANNWFNNAAIPPTAKAPEHHNDFGGFLGGPIRRNEMFFFLSYEGARLAQPQSMVIQVPSAFARSSAPVELRPYIDAYPQPNGQPISPTAYTAPFTGSYSNSAALDAGSARIDYTLSKRFTVFGRYDQAPSQSISRVSILSNLQAVEVDTKTLTLGFDMLLKPHLANSVRANFSTQAADLSYRLDSFGGAVPIRSNLLLGDLQPEQNLAYFQSFDTGFYQVGSGGRNRTRQLNFNDDLWIFRGAHQLKFGADYRALYLDVNPYQHEPFYMVFSTQDLLSSGSTDFFFTSTNLPTKFLTHALSLYGQDTWKASQRLTITFGVRWELNPAPSAREKTSLTTWKNVDNPPEITIAPPGTSLWATTYHNFAPRLGLAYALTGKGDYVIRLGGGIFYDLGTGRSGDLGFSFPNAFAVQAQNVLLPVSDLALHLPPVSLAPPYGSVITAFSPNLELPRSYQWNLALEKSFGGEQVVSATYAGQAGRDLLRQNILPRPNVNFTQPFELTGNDSQSNYHALQLQYRRPLGAGLQMLLNYAWSHSLDDASDDIALALSDAVISGARDYASSSFDVRHSFSGAVSYELPSAAKAGLLALLTKNWSIDTVVVARTGFPFNALLAMPSAFGGIGYTRPDRVPGEPLYVYGAQCMHTFGPTTQGGSGVLMAGQSCPGGKGLNPAAFSIPASPRQGTEGRNDIPGFGLTQVDLSIGRKISITDQVRLHFRADAFNLINHPNFANPFPQIDAGPANLLSTRMLNQGLGGLNPLFQQGGPRSLQLSLKMTF